MSLRRPVWALHVFVVGLALHNVVMAELWAAGVRGFALDVVSAWKEALLAAALGLVVWSRRGLPFKSSSTDWLALAFVVVVVVYGLVPQSWLGGAATHKGVLYGARHDLLPVAAYFLGRGLDLTREELRRVGVTILGTAAFVAAFGLVDVYLVPLQWWRDSGAPGWFEHQLGLIYRGLSGLPENFVYNTGNEHPLRRLTLTFLSPLATSYLLVVAFLLAVWWRGRALWLVPLLFAGLLWTHSRSSYLALAAGLVVLAWRAGAARDKLSLAAGAAAVIVAGALFVKGYPHFGPPTAFTATELKYQRSHAHATGKGATSGAVSDASTASHWQNLKDGVRRVVHHPQGFGLGNSGVTASRTEVEVKAGESTYTELGVDTGLLGALVFIAWSLALFWVAVRRQPWVGAALAAVLLLGLQTDVIGVPWLAVVVWALAGDAA